MEGIVSIKTGMAEQDKEISRIFDNERSRLRNFIKGKVGDDDLSEDILQDVFHQLVEAYRLMVPIERVGAWLFAVARNKVNDWFRKKKAIPQSKLNFGGDEEEQFFITDLLVDENDPDSELFREMTLDALEDALEELPEEQRSVFEAHEFEGKGFKQISEETGVPLNTLLSRKRYAVLHLRERLRDVYDELFE